MKFFKKSCKLLSLFLAVCMIVAVLPVTAFAKITYQQSCTGSESLVLSTKNDNASLTVALPGIGGKVASDTVYRYQATESDSGKNFINLTPSKLAGSVIEFNILFNNDSSNLYFMGGFVNQTGYDKYLETGKLDTSNITGKANYTVMEKLLRFNSNGVTIDPNKKLTTLSSDLKGKQLMDALTPGVWHTVSIRTPGLTNGSGESSFMLYVDGNEFTIPVSGTYYGTRHIRLFGTSDMYIDNLMVYESNALENVSDYKNSSLVPALTAVSEDITIKDGTITFKNDVTPAQLSAMISGADAVRVYTDATYTTLAENNAKITPSNKIVAAVKNGDTFERGYSYYNVDKFTYEEPGILDGDDDLSHGSGINADGSKPKCTVEKNIAGKFGKDATDLIYKITPAGETFSAGYNFYSGQTGLKTTVTEISLAYEEAMNFRLQLSFFLDAEGKTTVTDAYFFSITNGVFKTSTKGNSSIASTHRGKEFGTVNPGEWINIAVVVPGYETTGSASDVMYVYVNGVKNEIKLADPVYGTNHFRFAPLSGKSFYYDNVREYTIESGEVFDALKDAPPVVDFGTLKASGNIIGIDENTTVAQFKEKISTSAAVRVFEDKTYQKLLSDDDIIPFGATVVFAADNSRTTERVYSYFTFGEIVYEEPDLYDGTQTLSIAAGDGNTNKATVTPVYGVYGKAKSDASYKIDANYGTSGHNYIGPYPMNLKTTVVEFSFANSDNSPMVSSTINMYTAPVASNDTERLSHSFLVFKNDAVYVGSSDNIAKDSRGMKLCDAKPGQWVNIALVMPGYEDAGEAGASTVYIYTNGVKHDVSLVKPVYGIRHIRLYPDGSYSEIKSFYIDNYRVYYGDTEKYDPAKDAQPVVDLSKVNYYDDNINVADGTTVADFKASLTTKAAVRVFETASYLKELEDTDEMGAGNVVVFATANKRTTERAYSYYTVNSAISANFIRLLNASGKAIKGSQKDLEAAGEAYYLETVVSNKSTTDYTGLIAIAASYNEDGNMLKALIKPVTLTPGENTFGPGKKEVTFEGLETPKNGTLKAFLWYDGSNEPLCPDFKAEFNGIEEYHIIAFSNSYGNDAFSNLPAVAKAAGVDIYAVNMYTGGCTLDKHYNYMNGNGAYEKRIEYTPNGNITTEDVSFADGLNTYGYSWDYITIQSRSLQSYNFDYYYTPEKPYITALADYIRANSPSSEVMFYQTWALDSDTAQTSSYTKSLVEGLEKEQIRPTLFAKLKENYLRAAEMIGNPNRLVPVGEAINYAIGTLGFPEYVLKSDGSYDSSGASRGMYRDTTCHLATCGKILNSLTWYEYITGNDARENPYQNDGISAEDMVLLKEAAHWACSQVDYIPQN